MTGDPAQAAAASSASLESAIDAAGEAGYEWDLRNDRMTWFAQPLRILEVESVARLATGTSYQLLIGSEYAGSRYQTIRAGSVADDGTGVPYRLQYRFLPGGRRSARALWIEERGRWFAGPDGRPHVARGVVRVIDAEREELERLRHLSEHDELTGLLNRRKLIEGLEAEIAEAAATQRPFAFLMVSINNLSIINPTFGFEIGDEVIALIAERLKRELRAGDAIGRYSTNKLGLLIHDCEADGLQAVGRRLMAAVRDSTVRTSVTQISTTISIGAVQVPLHAGTPLDVVTTSLSALEEAREVPQDRMICYTPGRSVNGRKRSIETAESVVSALEQQRMRVALQPIVHATTWQPAFYECLLRIQGKDGSLVPASEFIPVAEQLGLSRMIDQRVLELAVGLVKAEPSLNISFNVSGLTSSDHNWLVLLHKLTGGDRAVTRRLTVEITETMAIADLDETLGFVDLLKEIGCRVAIDDFGAGYTSFRNLRSLGAEIVKLDGAFVRNLKDDKANRIFIETMVGLAKNFGMQTVAEMVSDEETARILADTGVDYLQGYQFGKPQVAPLPMPVRPGE